MIERPQDWTVWFDLDDTLWDFSANSIEALKEVYKHFSLDRYWPDAESWMESYHKINYPLWDKLSAGLISQAELRHERFFRPLVNAGMTAEEAQETTQEADGYYLDRLGRRSLLIEGAKELVEKIRVRGFKTGILSNGFSEVQYNKLHSGGLARLFDFVVLSDDIDIHKPDVRIYRHAETVAQTPPERSVMIGDNCETDIAGALNADWALSIWYNPRHSEFGKCLCEAVKTMTQRGRNESLIIVERLADIDI